jgi:hypothetical protein
MAEVLRALGILVVASACTRGPADEICPPAGTGDLVITELRGEQSGGDTWGQWIEVYNASGGDLDLEGTQLEVLSMDGSTDLHLLIRRSLPLAAGGYATLGVFDDTARPSHIDYGFGPDFSKQYPASGAITVSACGTESDRVVFTDLPMTGSWSLGEMPPTASGNDVDGAWCNDTTPGTDTTMLGLPGTPGEANHSCN